jgi:hypothetical protein
MKSGTHNLGCNRFNQLGLVKVEEDEVTLFVGTARIVLSHEQAKFLKDVLA